MNHKVIDDTKAFLDVAWYEQVPGQSIARSAGNNTQCRVSVDQAACHLIHRAVTTNSHNSIQATLAGCLGHRRSVSGTFCHLDIEVKQVVIDILSNELRNNPFARRSGNGIDDEQYFLFHRANLCNINEMREEKINKNCKIRRFLLKKH